jgi:type IV pilus assembly protein PilM
MREPGVWKGLVGVDGAGSPSVRVAFGPSPSRGSRANGGTEIAAMDGANAEVLRDLVRDHRLGGRPAAATLSGKDVLVRRISLPVLRPAEIHAALALEARKLVGYPVEEAEVRYEILGRTERGGSGPTLDLLMAVAPRSAVESVRAALASAGLHPVCLSVRPVALRALVRSHDASSESDVTAYLEMGSSESHLTIFRGDEIRFARSFAVGRNDFVEALRAVVVPGRGTVSLTPAETEALLAAYGVNPDAREGAITTPVPTAIPPSAVTVMLRPVLERLARELWNSFDYVHEQSQGQGVDRVRVLGPGAAIPGLCEHLGGVLRIGVAPAGEGKDPSWDTAAGLCALGPGSLNFLEPPHAGIAFRIASAIPQRIAVGAALVLLVSISLPAEVSVSRERRKVETLRAELQSLAPRTAAVGTFRAARAEEARSRALLASLQESRILWSEALRDLSHRVGDDARLTTFTILDPTPGAPNAGGDSAPPGAVAAAPRDVEITGVLRFDSAGPERLLGALMESLSASPYLANVRLVACHADREGSRFTLHAELTE